MLKNIGRAERTVICACGKVTFNRTVLIPADKKSAENLLRLHNCKSIAPLDCALGIDNLPFKITIRMMCKIAQEATRSKSYKNAQDRILSSYGIKLSVSTIESVTDYVGKIVYQEQQRLADVAKTSASNIASKQKRKRKEGVLYLAADGAMVHLRSDNEHGITEGWHESKHIVALSSDDINRVPKRNGGERTKIVKREFLGYIGSADEFEHHMLSLALRHNCYGVSKLVILSDGASWIYKRMKKLFPDAIIILDLYHAKENAGNFSKIVQPDNMTQQEFADCMCVLIDNGQIDELLKLLEQFKDVKTPDGVVNMYTYVVNYKDFMNYPLYKSMGFYVGSGIIESGNKQVMQNRMKLQGMRWNLDGAQHMLSLKAKFESRRWHEVVQLLRKHFSKDKVQSSASPLQSSQYW